MIGKSQIMKDLFFENISFLLKQQGIPVGKFEQSTGFSAGYISRAKKQNTVSLDFVTRSAMFLNISIDDLLEVDLKHKQIENNWAKIFCDDLCAEEKEKFKKLLLDLNSKNIITINIEVN